jgi:hypothetical protein
MGDPGYDFFATGGTPQPAATSDADTLPAETAAYGASVNRFGSPVALEHATHAPAPAAAPVAVAQVQDNPAYAAAYSVEVNRFGSPVTLEGAAPATPILPVPAPVPPPLASPGFNPDAAPVNRFGGPVVPADVPLTVPIAAPLGTPAPPSSAPAPFPVPAAAGYTPGAVNHFGTPLAAAAAPTGPYAAPGMGAVPTAAPGMVSTWDPRATNTRSRAVKAPSVPQGVRTAGVIGTIEGVLIGLLAIWALFGYLSLKGQLEELTAGSSTSAAFGATISSAVLIGVVVLFLQTALYLVAGIGSMQGKRWAAWVLLVVSSLNVLWALYSFVGGSSSGMTTLLTLLISGSAAVLLLSNDPRRWLLSG